MSNSKRAPLERPHILEDLGANVPSVRSTAPAHFGARNQVHDVLNGAGNVLAEFGPEKWQRGLSQREIEKLVAAYENLPPAEKQRFLASISMSPAILGMHIQQLPPRNRPELPPEDPVAPYCNVMSEEDRIKRSRSVPISRINLAKPSIWSRTVNACESKGIHTLGDLEDADPALLLAIPNFGDTMLSLCIEALKNYGLLRSEPWRDHALKIGSNG